MSHPKKKECPITNRKSFRSADWAGLPEDARMDMEPAVKRGPDDSYPVFLAGVTKLL